VLQEKRKNVHAGVVGTLVDSLESVGVLRVTYNPYRGNTFVLSATGDPMLTADTAALIVHEKKGFIYV
jgi:hypothetical protein